MYLLGLVIIERNYLDVYPYENWSAHSIPSFRQGETLMPSSLMMEEGTTSRPNLLTESDLISIMEKSGIGMIYV
jgi:DNA topoisomerase III